MMMTHALNIIIHASSKPPLTLNLISISMTNEYPSTNHLSALFQKMHLATLASPVRQFLKRLFLLSTSSVSESR